MDETKAKETFEQYYRRVKNDFHSALRAAGINDVPPSLVNVIEAKLLSDARLLWEMECKLDNHIKTLENIKAASSKLLA